MPHALTDLPPTPLPGFRAVPLDGALLYFHRATGTHIRIATPATVELRRQAPRVVMFGITNACNLACDFCSRDRGRPSRWTAASAAETLRGLAAAGVLEVAFGGGEPFVFPDFAALLGELRATTALALHVTTNGTLITPATWRTYAGLLDMVRVSVYPDGRWRSAARTLTAAAQRWGANILVDDAALDGLPDLLADLAALGAADVSVLTYVGAHAEHQLTADGRRRLGALITDSPVPVRLSVCAGAAIPVPWLHAGLSLPGDCGAGRDFVSITPDQGLLGCSFQDGASLPAHDAASILAGWRQRQDRLSVASSRRGCARSCSVRAVGAAHAGETVPTPVVAVWRSFSGNNSGECVMVAKFATVAEAETHLAELLPGWNPAEDCSAEWKALFVREQVVAPDQGFWYEAPRELLAIGRSVIALGYDSGDQLAHLRGLAWQRGGTVIPGGVHVHEHLTLLAAIRCRDADDAAALAAVVAAEAETAEINHAVAANGTDDWADSPQRMRAWTHGDRLLLALGFGRGHRDDDPTLTGRKTRLVTLAASRPLAAEIFCAEITDAELLAVKQRLGVDLPTRHRLIAQFGGWNPSKDSDQAHAFARSLGTQAATVIGQTVLIDGLERPKRLAVLAMRSDAAVTVLDGLDVIVHAHLYVIDPPTKGRKGTPREIDQAAVLHLLAIPPLRHLIIGTPTLALHGRTCALVLRTADPAAAMTALAAHAAGSGCEIHQSQSEVDPLAWAVRRVLADVAEAHVPAAR